jgi:general stress protein 26
VNVDEHLRRAFRDLPTGRVATVGPGGAPHVAPLWFVWPGDAIYLSTRVGSTTWLNVEVDPRVAVLLDRGRDWAELAGAQIEGTAELLPVEHPDLRVPMSLWHEKYRTMLSGDGFERITEDVPSLGFLRVSPVAIRSWDHALERGGVVRRRGST